MKKCGYFASYIAFFPFSIETQISSSVNDPKNIKLMYRSSGLKKKEKKDAAISTADWSGMCGD